MKIQGNSQIYLGLNRLSMMVILFLAGCSSSHSPAVESANPLKLNLIGPSTVYSNICSVFMVSLSKTSDQSYATSLINLELTLSSPSGSFFSTDSNCSDAVSTATIPSGEGFVFLYYKNTTAGDTVLTVSDLTTDLAPVSQPITVSSPLASNTLDDSFHGNGKVITTMTEYTSGVFTSIAIQPDGKIIAGGYATSSDEREDFVIARYSTEGFLDESFGTHGTVTTKISDFYYNEFKSIALQPDGKILATGVSFHNSNDSSIFLARYHSYGELDESFGSNQNGKVSVSLGGTNETAYAIALQSDHKVIVAGSTFLNSTYQFGLARYNSDGTLDRSFGESGTGLVNTPIGGYNDSIQSLVLQRDGKIIVAGYSSTSTYSHFVIARYTSNGVLDSSFGSNMNGKVVFDFDNNTRNYATSVAIQSDEKIVVAGYSYTGAPNQSQFAVARYTPDGLPDSSFGASQTGKVKTQIRASGGDHATSVRIQPDGKMILAGYSIYPTRDFALVRYNSDGIPDETFGTHGVSIIDIAGTSDEINALALQPDGKIVAGGYGGGDHFVLIRLWP